MKIFQRKLVFLISALIIALLAVGCGESVRTSQQLDEPMSQSTATIGSLVEAFSLDLIGVEGYALVGGLRGTGSSECPPEIRASLKQYILKRLPKHDIDRLINSSDTAVVVVTGQMPAAVSRPAYFDLKVTALEGTQTTSIEGGLLYGADLKAAGAFGMAMKVLATAQGPIFIDTIGSDKPDKKVGYVLAGGTVLDEYNVRLDLKVPNYMAANAICNRLNEKWPDVANAISASRIELKVPAEYKERKQRFISVVKAIYLMANPEITKERIRNAVRQLAASQEKHTSEIILEAIGNESIEKLSILLKSSDEQVRLRAARCILNLGGDEGLETLRAIAMDKGSTFRIEALEAIASGARRNDASAILRKLLCDDDFDIRLAAYENLRKLDDISITQRLIGRNFYLEQVVEARRKGIFVSRSGQPRIVLFGAPIYCRNNIFVQSRDDSIVINALADQKRVTLMRKHPARFNKAPIKLESSFKLSDIIQTLCAEPVSKSDQDGPGLGVSYAEVIGLLNQMCSEGVIKDVGAEDFHAGAMPKFQ